MLANANEYHLADCMSLITTFFKTKKTFLITILVLDVMHRSFLLSSPVLLLHSTGICFDLLKCPLPVASTLTSRLAFQVCLTSCSVPLLRGFCVSVNHWHIWPLGRSRYYSVSNRCFSCRLSQSQTTFLCFMLRLRSPQRSFIAVDISLQEVDEGWYETGWKVWYTHLMFSVRVYLAAKYAAAVRIFAQSISILISLSHGIPSTLLARF